MTLLLLHGVGRDRRDWEPLLPHLAGWQVVALDHRGHGRAPRAGSYLVADYARDASEYVKATFREPVAVMGHSLGAMVALAVAAECPLLVERVILEDPPFHTMGRGIADTPYQALFAGMREVANHGGAVESMTDGLAEIRMGGMRLGDVRDRESLRYSAECLERIDPDVFSPLLEGRWLDGFDYESLWPRVTCPVLLLQGDPAYGGAFTDADAAIAKRNLRNCTHRQFAGVGHQIHRTVPAEVGALIRSVLRFP